MKVATTILALCVGSLLALGMVMLYSSSWGMSQRTARPGVKAAAPANVAPGTSAVAGAGGNGAPGTAPSLVGARFLKMQIAWCAVGFVALLVTACMDYRTLKKISGPLLIISVLLLIATLVPGIGRKVGGARRWLPLGVANFQASELAKLALIIALAHYGERFQRKMPTLKWGVAIPGAGVALVLGLIFVEPDRGTTILLAAVSATMLLIAGVRWRFIVPPLILAVVGLAVSIWYDPMRFKRMASWLNLEEHKEDVGYQAYQAMLALGSGGWTGLGLGDSRQKFDFVPEHHTDFILSIIGEELGLVATLFVVFAFLALVVCGVLISRRSRDTFGLLLGAGITFLIGLQAFINIGVVTSVLPNKGISLPFISYGGSSLSIMLAAVGILFSVARQAEEAPPLAAAEGEAPALATTQLT